MAHRHVVRSEQQLPKWSVMSHRGFRESFVTGRSCATARDRHRARGALVVGVLLLTVFVALGSSSSVFARASDVSRAAATESGRWSAPVTLFRGQGSLLPSISCASARLCVAVGAKGSSGVGLSGATTWSSPVVIDTYGGLAAVSCAPGGSCIAVGASGLLGLRGVTYRFLGGKWSAGPTSGSDLFAVSCPTSNFCAAVDDLYAHGRGYVFNGKSWSTPMSIGESADSISCPTTTFCAAVSQSGKVTYYKAGTWSKPTSIDASGNTLDSISCASTTFCVAVDDNGNALTYVNGRWSKPTAIDPDFGFGGVSCPSTTFCVATGGTPDVRAAAYLYNGSRWSSPQTISGQIEFTLVSCPTVNFCAVAGQNSSSTAVYVATYRSLP